MLLTANAFEPPAFSLGARPRRCGCLLRRCLPPLVVVLLLVHHDVAAVLTVIPEHCTVPASGYSLLLPLAIDLANVPAFPSAHGWPVAAGESSAVPVHGPPQRKCYFATMPHSAMMQKRSVVPLLPHQHSGPVVAGQPQPPQNWPPPAGT